MIDWLVETNLVFPPVTNALKEPNGLLAAGGDLSPARLINAYSQGIFPWFNEGDPILWWSPDPRCVLFPEKAHISRSLRKQIIKSVNYDVTIDSAFTSVVEGCAESRKNQDGTWITQEMLDAYTDLHQLGVAHSVEYWHDGQLSGGLYGLAIGPFFFGESMFSRSKNASKIALVYLCKHLIKNNFKLIDCQVPNPHLFNLGAKLMPRNIYIECLQKNINQPIEITWSMSLNKKEFI